MNELKLKRWAERKGCTVEWGNMVGSYLGQSFRETFQTEAEAVERERQALACEDIGDDRVPVPLRRDCLR
jgi:hypothetical protein